MWVHRARKNGRVKGNPACQPEWGHLRHLPHLITHIWPITFVQASMAIAHSDGTRMHLGTHMYQRTLDFEPPWLHMGSLQTLAAESTP